MDAQQEVLRTRREFLRQAACAALGGAALANTIRDLRIINAAMAQEGPADYKALVCIFLNGGNDSNNLIIPNDSHYSNYAAIRQNLALPQSSILPINSLNGDGRQFGLHPNCPELQTLFGEGKLAFLFNVGTLVHPITRSQYYNGSVSKPPQLFSHSDQVTQWQTSIPDQPPRSGWGGRCADLLHSMQPDAEISLCTSVSGANTFENGNITHQYQVSTSGAVSLSSVSGDRLRAFKRLNGFDDATIQVYQGLDHINIQENAYADVVARSIQTGELLNTAIQPTAAANFWTTPFPSSTLGNQLKMVARLIAARSSLSLRRQIFFCSVGGYDTHTAQFNTSSLDGSHANLLNELSESMFAFQRAMEQLERAEQSTIANQVTAFTASDFGRTFPTNGQGSGHGWGGHQMIMGGAVKGQRYYGSYPILQVKGPDDTDTGRWIPRVSVDEYSATLATWFGVSSTYLGSIFPNLHRFAKPNLGFMM